MFGHIKALIVVLFLAVPLWILARPACLHFMSDQDFRLRRTVWLISTFAVFLSPSVWLFFAIIVPLSLWAVKKDSNPIAVMGIIGATAPACSVFVPHLFPVTLGRLLVLCIVIPGLLKRQDEHPHLSPAPRQQGVWLPSLLLLVFVTLQVTPFLQVYSVSEVVRREFLVILDTMLPFWFAIRMLKSYRSINEVLAVIVLTSVVVAPVAAFESVSGWLVYAGVAQQWGASLNPFAYLSRGDRLRALLTADHSLILGFSMAIAFGVWLHLQRAVTSRSIVWAGILLPWVGMWAAYSRGPWIAAILLMFAYFGLMPKGSGRVLKLAIWAGLLGTLVSLTPLGGRIIDSLPFVGTLDSGNVDYRSQLLALGMELIPRHPWFGDLHVEDHMESLRQGQGIVDVVNGFLLIALYYGLVPLGVLAWFLGVVLGRLQMASIRARRFDMHVSSLGSSLLACMLAALFFTWVAQFAGQIVTFAGLALAYARLVHADHNAGLQKGALPRGLHGPSIRGN